MIEDDVPRPTARLTLPPIDRLGVAELMAYAAELRAEITRVEREIAQKSSHRDAADSVFRQP
ncbi:MAG: DUF1192 domain-containing protein [Gemmatimonadaceae bacterium]|nr:DUF1192 domain-containing protein [Acetobacteraceae bacterium]